MAPPRTELSWSGWGDPAQARPLPVAIQALLRDGLGVQRESPPPESPDELALAPVRLAPELAWPHIASRYALLGEELLNKRAPVSAAR